MNAELRNELIRAVEGRGAHLDFESATADLPLQARGRVPDGGAHSPWQIVEHLRIAQRDMLDFSTGPDAYHPLDWPDDYWPDDSAPPNEKAWDHAIERFLADRSTFIDLLRDPSGDPLEPFEWGEGQSPAREAMQIAQHNSYHLGELIAVRRAIGAW